MKRKILGIVVAITMLTGLALGQASSSTAELRGNVTDPTGAIVPGSKVTLTDTVKGIVRTAVTDADGNYVFVGLLPSSYELKIEAQGFAATNARIDLTVGQQATLPFKLTAAALEATLNVTDGAVVIDTTRSYQAATINARNIVNLPIGRRSYLDYALLTPGVTDSDTIADASDFRVAQTPQSGLSFGGGNGRGNVVSIDGAETLNSSGGVLATLSQEAVQEFQIVRNSYSAEYGGASGGIVDIISKSGGNGIHGSAFGLFRDQRMDAKNIFDGKPDGKSKFNRQQYGGSFGGPLVKDRTFYFTSIERYTKNETTFVNLLRDPNIFNVNTASTDPLIRRQAAFFDGIASSTDPAALKGGVATLRSGLTTTNYARTVNLFNSSSGQFPFQGSQTMFSVRGDHVFSDKTSGYVRFYLNRAEEENQAAGSLTAVSRGRTQDFNNTGVLASHNTQFGSSLFNEVKFQYARNRLDNISNEQFGPEFNIEGYGNFNRDIFLPAQTIEHHYDIYDNVTKLAGSHTFKFGGSLWIWKVDTDSKTFLGGRFNFGSALPLSSLLGATPAAQRAHPLNQGVLGFSRGRNPDNTDYRDANGNGIADIFDTPMTSLQSFNLGLPIVYQQGFGDGRADSYTTRTGFYAQDTWRARQNLTLNYGLRYQINDEPFRIPTRYKDFQPRVGFSWDPFSDGKTAIRGGIGIYTGFVNNAIGNVTTELGGFGSPEEINIVLATATSGALGVPSSIAIYQSLLTRGVIGTRQISAADLAILGITPRAGAPLEVRFRIGDNYENPSSYQTSFGIQREIGGGFSLETSYMYSRGIHITRNRDNNQLKRTGPINPLNPDGGATFIRFPTAAQVAAGLTTDFAVPLRFQNNIWDSSADSFYHAFTASLTKRFSRRVGLNAHYTFSKAIDEVLDFNSDFSAQNPLNLNADRALSAFDQRHRAVFTAEVESPFQNLVARNWRIVPILISSSGRPFNILLGFDANNDGRSQSDRPGQAGRNTGIAENYLTLDMRLGRGFTIKETRRLEFTFEAFNLFNRVNMQGINNTVGTSLIGVTDFNLRGRRDRTPTEPLGFTSAGDARKLQLGLRFTF